MKKTSVKNKILKFLLISIVIMLIIIIAIKCFVLKEIPITEKIGNASAMSVSLNDSLHIKTYSTTKYFSLLNGKLYDRAYSMLTEEYQRYVPYETYLEEAKKINTNQGVTSIKQLSKHAYILTLENIDTQEITTYIAYINKFNSENFTLSPCGFVYYDILNMKSKNEQISAELIDYLVMDNSIQAKLKIKNNTKQNVEIDDITIEVSKGGIISNKFEPLILSGKEEREITIKYEDTNYYIPSAITVITDGAKLKFEL